MSKKQYDTNSNDPANNPDEFLDKKDVTISVTNSDEHVNFNTATDNPELLPDNKCTAKGLISAYEQISGNRWIDMLPMVALLILGLSCMLYWNIPQNDTVLVWQDLEYTTTAEQDVITTENEASAGQSSKLAIRTQPGRYPHDNSKLIPATDSLFHSREKIVENGPLNSYKKDPVMVLNKLKLPESITSSTNEHQYLHHDIKLDNLISRYLAPDYSAKQLMNSEFNKQCKKLGSGFNNLSKLMPKNSLINKTLLLNTYVQEYNKTALHLEKDKIIFISCHGSISSSDCDLTFGPEGLNSAPENLDCERLIKNYPLGALLFRLNEQEDWNLYSSPEHGIKTKKDDSLEFTINYKCSKENSLSGKFLVSVFSSQ
jgi:hypothetical protein